ncbi:hypothetical protein C8J56DRAFT_895718 [Mycena floridula]|nr:hypothetical protein C8J56DRAFT_895718 [Mycena floridula]
MDYNCDPPQKLPIPGLIHPSQGTPDASRDNIQNDEVDASKEFSSDSLISSKNNSMPKYDMFGLAESQTQQVDEDLNEGSQKENFSAEINSLQPVQLSRPSSPRTPSRLQPLSRTPVERVLKSPARKTQKPLPKPLSKAAPPTSNVSPTPISPNCDPPISVNRYKQVAKRRRSASQDSFAGPIEDNISNFQIPISELRAKVGDDDDDDDESQNMSDKAKIDYSLRVTRFLPTSVANPPQQSDERQSQDSQDASQKHSQESVLDPDLAAEAQPRSQDSHTGGQSQGPSQPDSNYASDAHSSDYAHFGEGEAEEEIQETQDIATQPSWIPSVLPAEDTPLPIVNHMLDISYFPSATPLPSVDHNLVIDDSAVPSGDIIETQLTFTPPTPALSRPLPVIAPPSSEVIPDSEPPLEDADVTMGPPPPPRPASKSFPRRNRVEDDEIIPDSLEIEETKDMESEDEPMDEDEESIPLRLLDAGLTGKKDKGKPIVQVTVSSAKKPSRGSTKTPVPARQTRKKAAEEVIPSSVPNETVSRRQPPRRGNARSARGTGKGKGKGATGKARTTRKTDDGDSDSDDQLRLRDEDDRTELADEEKPMEFNHSLKRPYGSESSKSNKKRKIFDESPSVRTRASSSLRPARVFRVIGFWKQNKIWYTGSVIGKLPNGLYVVKFDDDCQAELPLAHLRQYEIRPNDRIFIHDLNVSVHQFIRRHDQDIVQVIERKTIVEYPVKDISIAARVIEEDWSDRMLTDGSIELNEVLPSQRSSRRSPSRGFSLASTRSSSSKPLSGYGIILTLSEGNDDDRAAIKAQIVAKGATLVEDFESVISFASSASVDGSVTFFSNQVEWNADIPIRHLFVVADTYSQKPKFLTGVGFGVPCLNKRWIEDTTLVICAGLSDHLFNIMDNPIPTKLLAHTSVFCVGKDLAHRGISIILLSMGASKVLSAPEISTDAWTDYDYVLFYDKKSFQASPRKSTAKAVLWDWMKESLISARLMPLP